MKHPVTNEVQILKEATLYQYGTQFNEIIPSGYSIYIEDPSLSLTQNYDLKGFALVEDSQTLISSKFTVTGNATLWAVIKLEDDIRKIVHNDYFEVDLNYGITTIGKLYSNAPAAWSNIEGVVLKPANSTLRGKVTIPSVFTYNDKEYKVIGLSSFKSNIDITHIFAASGKTDSSLKVIEEACFDGTKLCYFDFDIFNLLCIKKNGFKGCPLQNNTFGSMLERVENGSFQNGFTEKITTLNIPASVVFMGSNAFGFLNIGRDKTNILNIGSPNALSKFNLSNPGSNTALQQNEGERFATINFYSSIYSSSSDTVGQITVEKWFINYKVLLGNLNINPDQANPVI